MNNMDNNTSELTSEHTIIRVYDIVVISIYTETNSPGTTVQNNGFSVQRTDQRRLVDLDIDDQLIGKLTELGIDVSEDLRKLWRIECEVHEDPSLKIMSKKKSKTQWICLKNYSFSDIFFDDKRQDGERLEINLNQEGQVQ